MKRLFVASALVVCLAAGLWLLRPGKEVVPPAAPVVMPTFAPPVVPAAASAEPPCRFNQGHLLAFDVTSTTSVRLSSQLAAFATGTRPETESRSTGRLTFEVLRVEPSSAVLLAHLSAATGGFEAPATEGPQKAFLVRVNERCEVAGFARHQETPRARARILQSLAHELWFSLPTTASPAMVEFDTSMGHASGMLYEAGGSAKRTFIRTIQHLAQPWSPAMNGVIVEKSRTVIRRGDGVWFDAIEGVEEYSVPGVVTRGTAALQVDTGTPDASTLANQSRDESQYLWENCFSEVPDQRVRAFVPADHQQRVEAMRNVSYPDALEHMLTKFDTTSNLHEQARDMSAFLDAHPDQIPEYAGALLTEFEPEWKPAGFLALSGAQNVAAREVLLDVWREREANPTDRIRASLGLVTRRDVGAPLAREMLAEARRSGTPAQRNVSQQALLHVGILAGLRPQEQEIQEVVHAGLAAELSGRATPIERAAVYSAIGNTGDLSFLPELDRASRNPDPDSRAIVPIGMRRMPVEAVRDFTLDWIRRETSPDVMRELFEVVQHQYQDVGKVVDAELAAEAVKYLRRQPRILTRQSILQMLRPLVSVDDDVRAAFRDQLKVEYEANTGMFSYIATCLPEEDVRAVLATIPSLADQHRGVSLPAASKQPAPVPTEPPLEMMPRLEESP